MSEPRIEPFLGGRALVRGGLLAAAAGAGLLAVGWTLDPRQAAFSYLTAWAYGLAVAVGALIFLMIGHAMQATWPIAVRRLVEAVTAALPLFALLFIPIALSLGTLYEWVSPRPGAGLEAEHAAHLLHHKAPYLNVPFFLARAALYFAIWIGLAELLRGWSLRQDADGDGDGALAARARMVSGVGLPAVGLALTFGSFDWLMSLTPEWYSTAYGLYYFAEGFLGALALTIILTRRAEVGGPLAGRVDGSHYHALGRLLFAFTVFWAYIAFFQGLIIYLANKPEEVTWYVPRIAGSWGQLLVVLIVGHFALPFFILLSRRLKFRGGALAPVAAWQLAMGYLDLHWVVLPVLHPSGFSPHWLDLAALLTVGGAATAFATWRQRGHAPAAHRDARYAASLAYRSPG